MTSMLHVIQWANVGYVTDHIGKTLFEKMGLAPD